MTRDQIAAASNDELVDRLAQLDAAAVRQYHRSVMPQTRKERAWIWQELGSRRQANRLRMTANAIRSKTTARTLRLLAR